MSTKKAGCCGGFDGLTCRMVIETKRVFDGCAFTDGNVSLTLVTAEQIPANATFTSARTVGGEFNVFAISEGSDGCCRVCGEIVTRFAVTYSQGGNLYTVAAEYRENRDVLLRLPINGSLVPYSIEVQTVMAVASGAIVGNNTVTVNGCLLQIIKVTAPVDILVPTYGYCKYPPCTGSACRGIATDIFPVFPIDSSE